MGLDEGGIGRIRQILICRNTMCIAMLSSHNGICLILSRALKMSTQKKMSVGFLLSFSVVLMPTLFCSSVWQLRFIYLTMYPYRSKTRRDFSCGAGTACSRPTIAHQFLIGWRRTAGVKAGSPGRRVCHTWCMVTKDFTPSSLSRRLHARGRALQFGCFLNVIREKNKIYLKMCIFSIL